MLSKIKKVLVSLALASSLALAPMNVSADNPKLSKNDNSGKTNVYMTGTRFAPDWVLEIAEKVTIDLDELSAKSSDVHNTEVASGKLAVYLESVSDWSSSNRLNVTPTFSILQKVGENDADPSVKFTAKSDTSLEEPDIEANVTLDTLSVSASLLKIGTYTQGNLTEGSNVFTFSSSEAETSKTVDLGVDGTLAQTIRSNFPDKISGMSSATNENAESAEEPSLAADQQIGTITYTCSFVSNS